MHVLWVTEHARFLGGAERYVAETARLLVDRGVRSTLLYGADHSPEPDFVQSFDRSFPMADVRIQVRDMKPDVAFVHQLHGVRATSEIVDGRVPVVRFFHDHELFCLRRHKYTTLGHRTCRRTLGPGCYACLGFLNRSNRWPGVGISTLGRLRRELRANLNFKSFVTASAYMRQHVVDHGFEAAAVHVNPLFVRPPDRDAPIDREPGRILFVGGLVRGKGLDILLDAMAGLPADTTLDVVGSGRQEHMFRKRCGSLGINGRIDFQGTLGQGELEEKYRMASCLVVPSRAPETFGMVGPEALRHGTPVIAADVGGMGEWLQHEETGLAFAANDVAGLTLALQGVLNDPAGAREMGMRGRAMVEESLGPKRHLDTLMGILDRAAQDKGDVA